MTSPQPDMNELIARASEMQAQLQQAQQEILNTEVTGTAGNGLVSVTMTGGAEVKAVTIDPQVVDPEDVDTLQDLVLGAFRDAHQKAGEVAQEKMGPFSDAQGGDLSGMFG
ncbi:YbaB/EbfC family nucleoid-associated protein [Corynebacterium tapiri]|uniref:Nucleoid-associated protein FHE74_06875 n=1 Tax=Corynebacterium tapiri TaxID=1448266 RepID=A0A5C4U4D1_9CORY|nr:YbaB/EbfC family nucleoid-associated protein [Corynebacterium tapiri]TNL97385.1 YbaB/EbfC family nucleoid-associated protein [Corynebacterium tapiri]